MYSLLPSASSSGYTSGGTVIYGRTPFYSVVLPFTFGVELGVHEWRRRAEDPAEEEEVADLADHLPNKEGAIRPAAK